MQFVDVMVYSETQQGILDMVAEFVPPVDDGDGGTYSPNVTYDWMPPGTMLLKQDEPDNEYDEDNWYCNVRFKGDSYEGGLNALAAAEAAYQDGVQVKIYPSSRQPLVTHSFPWLNSGSENVYFTRIEDGSYTPAWPRRIYVGGMSQPPVEETRARANELC